MEAVYCNTIPMLPRRLTYPELFKEASNPQLFYENSEDLIEKITYAIHNIVKLRENSFGNIAVNYDWSNLVNVYDLELMKLLN